eukprot:Pgem_evm1s13689
MTCASSKNCGCFSCIGGFSSWGRTGNGENCIGKSSTTLEATPNTTPILFQNEIATIWLHNKFWIC